MVDRLQAGPYRTVQLDTGEQAPFYIIPFDESGRCQGPLTREDLLTTARQEGYTDILMFCHGWNTDWHGATSAYDGFLSGYMEMRRKRGLTYSGPFRPLLVGIFWPSIILVWPWERAPQIAATPEVARQMLDAQVAQERQEIQSIAATLSPQDVERFYALVQRSDGLGLDEQMELARMLAPIYKGEGEDEIATETSQPSQEQIVTIWRRIARQTPVLAPASTQAPAGQGGFVRGSRRPTGANPGRQTGTADAQPRPAPQAAGDIDLDPRQLIRFATVLQMKDRAGVVGAHGVGALLTDLLASTTGRVHLIGHSYGCKAALSAICFPKQLPRKVNSVLLLQPAISYLCFAEDATSQHQPGGYRKALDRVEQPILTTFSPHDVPLTTFFHWAVRRPTDIGDQQIAAGPPPSVYAALGGFGPGGCAPGECSEVPMQPVGDQYNLGPGTAKILSLNGTNTIFGHGDISNPFVWWTLYNQLNSM